MRGRLTERNFAGWPWRRLLIATTNQGDPTGLLRPADALELREAPWVALRVFLRGNENHFTQINLYWWFAGLLYGAELLSVRLTAGQSVFTLDPELGTNPSGFAWRECDSINAGSSSGPLAREIRAIDNNQHVLYVPSCDATYIAARQSNKSAAAAGSLVLMRPALTLPPAAAA